MATASGNGWSKRWLAIPVVAYVFVFALLGGVGFALWAKGNGSLPWMPGSERASSPPAKAAQLELVPLGRGLELPPRVARPEATAPTEVKVAPQPAMPLPLQAEATSSDSAALLPKTPEPSTSQCGVEPGPWPADRTNQIKIIQLLLRDLGFYGGTTYGTMGPATRAAIGKFQLAANEAETGEPTEALFAALKRKCTSPSP